MIEENRQKALQRRAAAALAKTNQVMSPVPSSGAENPPTMQKSEKSAAFMASFLTPKPATPTPDAFVFKSNQPTPLNTNLPTRTPLNPTLNTGTPNQNRTPLNPTLSVAPKNDAFTFKSNQLNTPQSSPGEIPAQYKIEVEEIPTRLTLEIVNPQCFKVSWAKDDRLTSEVWNHLRSWPGAQRDGIGEEPLKWDRGFYFPVDNYPQILAMCRGEQGSLYKFPVDPPPNFALWGVASFFKYSSAMNMVRRTADVIMAQCEHEFNPRIREKLFPYQQESVEFALKRGGRILLADEMGLGKTVQSLAILCSFVENLPALIICPSAVRPVWREEALRFLPQFGVPCENKIPPKRRRKRKKPEDEEPPPEEIKLEAQVILNSKDVLRPEAKLVIISYDLVSRAGNERFRRTYDGQPYKMIVCDESHNLKTLESNRTKTVMPMLKQAKVAILCTGTPVLNRASELYPQIAGLLPNFIPSFEEFAIRYSVRKDFTINMRRLTTWVGAIRARELHTMLKSSIMVRRLKPEVAQQLPDKFRQRVPLDDEKLDKKILAEISGKMEGGSMEYGFDGMGMGEPTGKMKSIMEIFTLTALAKLKAVESYLETLVESETRFICFAHHQTMLKGLAERLKKDKVTFVLIEGSTSAQLRDVYCQAFNTVPGEEGFTSSAPQVALLSITACSSGLNLHRGGCSTVVFAELFWVTGTLLQAEDRVHRIGQENTVNIHYLIAANTIDDIMYRVIDQKCNDMTGILDGKAKGLDATKVEAPVPAPLILRLLAESFGIFSRRLAPRFPFWAPYRQLTVIPWSHLLFWHILS